jgi:hypothetical protein
MPPDIGVYGHLHDVRSGRLQEIASARRVPAEAARAA